MHVKQVYKRFLISTENNLFWQTSWCCFVWLSYAYL